MYNLKKIKITFISLLLPFSFISAATESVEINPGSKKYLDKKNGFRGVNFYESPIKLSKAAKCIDKQNFDYKNSTRTKIKECILEYQIKPLLGNTINNIKYRYYQNKLYEIEINFRADNNKGLLSYSNRKRKSNSSSSFKDEYSNFANQEISICKNSVIKQLEEVWGQRDRNRSSYIEWTGERVSAQLDERCDSLVLNDIGLQKEINDTNAEKRIELIESEF